MAELLPPELQVAQPKTTLKPQESLEQNVVKNVENYLKTANAATKGIRQGWVENYDFVVKGNQWSIRRPKHRFSEVINVTWANIMTEVGIETDQSPKFDYIPQDPSDYQFSEILNEINNANWAKPINRGFGWLDKTQHIDFLRKIYDVAHAEITWDPTLENGLGDVCYKVLNPLGCYWDPVAKDISEARYFIYVEPIPTTVLQHKFPKMSENIKSDFQPMGNRPNDTDTYNIDYQFTSTGMTGQLSTSPIERSGKFGGEPMTLLIRCWLKDEATETVEKENPEKPGEKVYELKKRYPKGRYVEIACKHLLVDEGENGEINQDYPHLFEDGLFPIATLKNYDYGEYIGQNEVDHQKGTQKTLNYIISHAMDQFKKGASPQWVVGEVNQDILNKITDEPGLKIPVSDVNQIRQEQGPGVHPSTWNLIDTVKGLHDQVSGMSDAAGRGIPDPNVGSGKMLDIFQTIAQTRTRLKSRSLAGYLTQIGLLCTSRYLQFYTDKRVFRITNQDGYPEHVEFYIDKSDLDKEGNPTAKVTRYNLEENMMTSQPTEKFPVKGLPDVRINPASALPFSKQLEQDKATQAFNAGVITGLDYLKAIDWPNPESTWNKVQEQNATMAQQQGVPK